MVPYDICILEWYCLLDIGTNISTKSKCEVFFLSIDYYIPWVIIEQPLYTITKMYIPVNNKDSRSERQSIKQRSVPVLKYATVVMSPVFNEF